MKVTKEWTMDMPWGKLAMISWGDSRKPPVLLLHGYVDTAATFVPLVEQLTDDYYYVAFDIPGHGKSDPFPAGISVSMLVVIEVIRKVVESMQWETFIYLAHSMAAVIGLFYNYVYPNRMSSMILLDPGPAFGMYHFVHHHQNLWYNYCFDDYYSNYERYNAKNTKLYHYEDAVTLSASNRNLTVEQAEIILSRSLQLEGDKYRFTMDPRMKLISNIPVSKETIHTVISRNTLPTLVLQASKNNSVEPGTSFTLYILNNSMKSPNYRKVTVVGEHDFHITNPNEAGNHVNNFLTNKNCRHSKCKI